MEFVVVRATVDDALWIANATLQAERAHTGKGIWDTLLCDEDGSEVKALECLKQVIATIPESHLYYGNCFLAKTSDGGMNVSSCCGYGGEGITTIQATFEGLKIACMSVMGWGIDRFEERRAKLSFLKTGFPDWPPYEKSWWLETIYTQNDFRGKGLSFRLIQHCLQEARDRGYLQSMLLVAEGNVAAMNLYLKVGFNHLYKDDNKKEEERAFIYSDSCIPVCGCRGFDILLRVL